MSAIETSVILTWAVTKKCPFRDELDAGELVITLAEDAPELHDLAGAIFGLLATPVTHEDFTRAVADMLPPGSEVVTTWNTGPFGVTVRSRVLEDGEVTSE
jgi:hypothetical protein